MLHSVKRFSSSLIKPLSDSTVLVKGMMQPDLKLIKKTCT
jgi:hypothetical protein